MDQATLAKIAPTIAALGVTATQAAAFVAARSPAPKSNPVAPVTKAQVVALADAYYRNGVPSGGLPELCSVCSPPLKLSQVVALVRELRAIEDAVDAGGAK